MGKRPECHMIYPGRKTRVFRLRGEITQIKKYQEEIDNDKDGNQSK